MIKTKKGFDLMIITKGNTITIVVDNEEVEDYLNYYFHKYPSRRKKPIDSPIPPSLNLWGNMNRQAKNNLKQNWSDFVVWLINKHEVSEKNIQRCKMTYKYFFHTKHKRDLSNYVCKFFEDGLVVAGFLEDDNYTVVDPLILTFGGYCKENPRIEIVIERLDLE